MKHLILGLAASTVMTSAAFAELLDLEKDVLTFGFIKLTDMAPLAIAYEQGYFLDEGFLSPSKPRPTGKCCWMG